MAFARRRGRAGLCPEFRLMRERHAEKIRLPIERRTCSSRSCPTPCGQELSFATDSFSHCPMRPNLSMLADTSGETCSRCARASTCLLPPSCQRTMPSCARHLKLSLRSWYKNERRKGAENRRHRGNGDSSPRKAVAPAWEVAVCMLGLQANVVQANDQQRDHSDPPRQRVGSPLVRPDFARSPDHHEVHKPDGKCRDDRPPARLPARLLQRFHVPPHGSKRGSNRPAVPSKAA